MSLSALAHAFEEARKGTPADVAGARVLASAFLASTEAQGVGQLSARVAFIRDYELVNRRLAIEGLGLLRAFVGRADTAPEARLTYARLVDVASTLLEIPKTWFRSKPAENEKLRGVLAVCQAIGEFGAVP